jgi:2-polyprenyl-3-methyl-5-hydroxy-6-metoxy-1,4-benzoquinol methylase
MVAGRWIQYAVTLAGGNGMSPIQIKLIVIFNLVFCLAFFLLALRKRPASRSAASAPVCDAPQAAELCPVCALPSSAPCRRAFPGYVEGTAYDIYHCCRCNTNYIGTVQESADLYHSIYSAGSCAGYDRYRSYAERVLQEPDPLAYLASLEPAYFAVQQYLSDKAGHRILDMGCGYGYLTYALRCRGFEAIGVDTSQAALEVARRNYGAYFHHADAQRFARACSQRFDLIVGIEWIEHVPDPLAHLAELIRLLTSQGAILLTTPNKDFCGPASVWQTDLPPVHRVWLSRRSLIRIAEVLGCECHFMPLAGHAPRHENKLAKFLGMRVARKSQPLMTRDGRPAVREPGLSRWPRYFCNWLLHEVGPVRNLGNLVHNRLVKRDETLAVILQKRDP